MTWTHPLVTLLCLAHGSESNRFVRALALLQAAEEVCVPERRPLRGRSTFAVTSSEMTGARPGAGRWEPSSRLQETGQPGEVAGGHCQDEACADFVCDLRQACVTSHVTQKSRHSAIDGRNARYEGYALSQKHRMRTDRRARGIARATRPRHRETVPEWKLIQRPAKARSLRAALAALVRAALPPRRLLRRQGSHNLTAGQINPQERCPNSPPPPPLRASASSL